MSNSSCLTDSHLCCCHRSVTRDDAYSILGKAGLARYLQCTPGRSVLLHTLCPHLNPDQSSYQSHLLNTTLRLLPSIMSHVSYSTIVSYFCSFPTSLLWDSIGFGNPSPAPPHIVTLPNNQMSVLFLVLWMWSWLSQLSDAVFIRCVRISGGKPPRLRQTLTHSSNIPPPKWDAHVCNCLKSNRTTLVRSQGVIGT